MPEEGKHFSYVLEQEEKLKAQIKGMAKKLEELDDRLTEVERFCQ